MTTRRAPVVLAPDEGLELPTPPLRGNDYHLSPGSPARDAGETLAGVTEDLSGAPRPQGAASDIGAYEFRAAPTPVSLTVIRTGSGTVTSAPAGLDCGSSCAATFPSGTGAGWRRRLRRLVGRRLLRHRSLHDHTCRRDDRDGDLCVGDSGPHGDRCGCGHRHGDQRAGRARP